MKKTTIYIVLLLLITSVSFAQNERSAHGQEHNPGYSNTDTTRLQVSNAEWKKILSADLYAVAREKDAAPNFILTFLITAKASALTAGLAYFFIRFLMRLNDGLVMPRKDEM